MINEVSKGTSLDLIYEKFVRKVTDFSFEFNEDSDMFSYLETAIANYYPPKKDETYWDINSAFNCFNNTLTTFDMTTIINLMTIEWLERQIYQFNLMSTTFGTKDFSQTSNANILKQMKELSNSLSYEVELKTTRKSHLES